MKILTFYNKQSLCLKKKMRQGTILERRTDDYDYGDIDGS